MDTLIKTFDEFASYLDEVGFMTLSGNPLGYPNLSTLTEPGQWHTNLDTDPWLWKTRIVEERSASYAKLFLGLPGFISRAWYPVFLAARRGGDSFDDAWEKGVMSPEARRIYQLFDGRTRLAAHEIKQLGGFTQTKSRYESAMAALQTGMLITVSGMTRMTTLDGRPHSWPVTEYMRVEDWVWYDTVELSKLLNHKQAEEKITAKVLEIIPEADRQKIDRFIGA